jgi:putative hemolysin
MTVTEIMVPRTEMVAFASSMTPADLLEEVLNDRFTRVPIYEDTIDNVLGVVHLKDLIKHARTGATDLQGILNPVIRVPERKGILDLLADMQRGFNHVAIVKDEFAITQGMVTQEDILEEIVGEIRDEFDSEELHEVRRLSDGSYDVLARVSVLDFNRESNWEIAAERGDTLGGLLFNTLERAPRKGEVVHLPGYDLQCLDVSGSRITRVRVTERPEESTK